ncbi:MAG: DUF952 domain-containing protein, partial [Pseudomonadota bacterium]
VDVARLGTALRWERSRNGENFPHLYRALQRDDVLAIQGIEIGDDGRHRLADARGDSCEETIG